VHHDAPKLIVILILAVILLELLRAVTGKLESLARGAEEVSRGRAQQLRTLASVIHGGGMFVILFVAALQVLPLFGVNMGPLLASAGVAGLAIGFGAQTLVHDVINGFFILMENQYQVGDTVKIGGVGGTVEVMTLRRTVLRDVDGSVHNIPNSQITVVSNLTRDWARLSLQVSVAYSENSDKVIGVLREAAQEFRNDPQWNESLVADPEVPGIDRIGAGEADYLVLVKTRPGQQYNVSRELRRRIKECLEKNKIQTPGPARIFLGDVQRQPQAPEVK
jgi:small conductance mechanosensitive channel